MNKVLFSSSSDDWATPQWLFDSLNNLYHFDLDPCSSDSNAKCSHHFTIKENGLLQSWDGFRVFCNPPYGRSVSSWVKKAYDSRALTVMLLPARTDTSWFHDYIYGHAQIFFIRGRLRFNDSNPAPFPSMIVVFDNLEELEFVAS